MKLSKYFKKYGGDAVASGTYGCVFRPPLYCENSNQTFDASRYVSKLMKTKDVYTEINEVSIIKNILLSSVSRDYIDKYYILANDGDICKININNLNEKGKKNIKYLKTGEIGGTHDCKNIYPSASHIVNNHNNYMVLNMIDGGEDLDIYLKNNILTLTLFNKLNNSLIDLLQNGIVKMNSLGIYHCDLKSLNLVYKDRVRIIDWGIAARLDVPFTKDNFNKNIQSIQIYHQMYYGLPFTNILLYNSFEFIKKKYNTADKYKTYLKQAYNDNYIVYLHLLNKYNKDVIKSEKSLIDIIIDYQTAVIYSGLSKEEIFNTVFFKNADIFGFLQIYINISYNLENTTNPTLKTVYNNIKSLISKYILSNNYAITPYSVDEIISDLNNLTKEKSLSKSKKSLDAELEYLVEYFSDKKTRKKTSKKISKLTKKAKCKEQKNCQYSKSVPFRRTKKNKKKKINVSV